MTAITFLQALFIGSMSGLLAGLILLHILDIRDRARYDRDRLRQLQLVLTLIQHTKTLIRLPTPSTLQPRLIVGGGPTPSDQTRLATILVLYDALRLIADAPHSRISPKEHAELTIPFSQFLSASKTPLLLRPPIPPASYRHLFDSLESLPWLTPQIITLKNALVFFLVISYHPCSI